MSFNTELSYGEIINNSKLIEVFKCGNMGGMRRSNKTNTLVIISDHTKGLYDDIWKGDILHYTGMGKLGDQDVNFSQNRTLKESNINGVDVFLFEVFEPNNYMYRGQVKLIDEPYVSRQLDDERNPRKVWIFPLKLISGQAIDEVVLDNSYDKKENRAKRLSYEELKNRAELSQTTDNSMRYTKTQTYERNAYVSELAKRNAKGICQLCGSKAPFANKKGEPYLETHHLIWLSRGGSDTIDNTVALCPNCHRKMHIVDDEQDIITLKNILNN